MNTYFQKRFALTTKGAKDFSKGVFFTTLLNLSLMLPAIFIFLFLEDYLLPIVNPLSSATNSIGYYVLIAISFMAVIYIIARFQYRSTYTTVYDESANRRISVAEKLRKLPLAFFGEKNLSDLTSTIMDDNTHLEQTFSHAVPQLLASIVSMFIIAIGLFFYNWQLALALLWVVPVAATVIFLSKRAMSKEHKSFYQIKRGVTEQIQEGLETIQEMKAYNQEKNYMESLSRNLKRFERSLIHGELIVGVLINISYVLLKLGLATVIIAGAMLLTNGSINLLMYLVFLMIATSIYNPIIDVFNNMAVLVFLDVRINRMREMEAMPVQQGEKEFKPDNYDIEFHHVDFSYEMGKQVLQGVSFIAKQGEVTALVGPSGGGKSTSAKLAARFWDIDKGCITLGGEDISKIDPEILLQNYSVVFQDVTLFNTSVMDNIRLGKRDATDEEVIRVAKLAQCDEFVSKMPNAYHSIIGENGERLSGGERQRISIARALLKDAPIVLLDEATASLDVENETRIQVGISALIKNKTVIIIAHRMRTVANANKIVVLEYGKLVESGDPKELREQNGVFAKMVERQMDNDKSTVPEI
jgi:ATP-binding cassette subfamily B protein